MVDDNYDISGQNVGVSSLAFDGRAYMGASDNFNLTGTLPSGLPDGYSYTLPETNYLGTSAQPAVSQVPQSSGITLSGILDGVSATAKTGLDLWKTVAQIDMAAATQEAQVKIAQANQDLQKVTALGNIDVAKTRAQTEAKVAMLQAGTEVAKAEAAANQAVNGTGGTFVAKVPSINWAVVVPLIGLGVLLWNTKKGKK